MFLFVVRLQGLASFSVRGPEEASKSSLQIGVPKRTAK